LTSIQAADAMSGHNHRDRASRHEWKAKRSNQSGSKQSHSATTEDFDVHCLWTAPEMQKLGKSNVVSL